MKLPHEMPGAGRQPAGESWHYVAGHEPPELRIQMLIDELVDRADEIDELRQEVAELRTRIRHLERRDLYAHAG